MSLGVALSSDAEADPDPAVGGSVVVDRDLLPGLDIPNGPERLDLSSFAIVRCVRLIAVIVERAVTQDQGDGIVSPSEDVVGEFRPRRVAEDFPDRYQDDRRPLDDGAFANRLACEDAAPFLLAPSHLYQITVHQRHLEWIPRSCHVPSARQYSK